VVKFRLNYSESIVDLKFDSKSRELSKSTAQDINWTNV